MDLLTSGYLDVVECELGLVGILCSLSFSICSSCSFGMVLAVFWHIVM